jgi:acyl-CoA thioesterase FadM
MLILTSRIVTQVALGHLRPVALKKHLPKAVVFDVPFRCWPVDIDMFMHMNNASYVRVAELARWRIFPQSGIIDLAKKKGIIFLVVGQQVSYLKQLPPFAKFIVRTTVTTSDNKWVHYSHSFQKPDSGNKEPYVYATVDVKAVMKEKTGKTIRLTDLASESDFYKHLADDVEEVKK